jgi:5-formyltetrahydrofolate cyclo-ligase
MKPSVAEEKQDLRRRVRALEKTLSSRYKSESDEKINRFVCALPGYLAAETIFCFIGTEHEINTEGILTDALNRGKRLCVPFIAKKGVMLLKEITSLSCLRPGFFGILEPPEGCETFSFEEVDFAVIPCLSASRNGRRLGQGGGYYDRFLTQYRSQAVLVCREALLRSDIPAESHDMPVPWVVTERGLYEDGVPER